MAKNVKELIKEVEGAIEVLEGVKAYLAGEGASSAKAKAPTQTGKGKKVAEEEEEDEEDSDDRRAELEAMGYNDLKALVSKLGGKAVGKKPDLIELILELEEGGADSEEDEEEEEEAPKSKKNSKSSKKAKEEEEEEEEEESEDDEEELTEEGMREQLAEFEDDELKDIAKEMGIATKGKTSKAIINLLVKDLEKLDETLEAMGYYEEEDSEEEDSEEEEDGESLADKLAELDQEDLASICADNGLSAKGKKQALIDRIVEAVENGDIEEDDLFEEGEDSEDKDSDDEEEEGASVEEIVEDLELSDLKLVAKELGITVTKTSKAPALKKTILAEDEDAIIEALEAHGLAGEDEDSEDDSEEDEDDVEVSAKVKKAEDKVEADIRAKVKSKKLKDSAMKKFLQDYYDGDADCAECNCSPDERLECYIKIQRRLVDDEGELHEGNDPYERGGENFCCGKKLVAGKKKGTFVCEVCGEEYKFED